MERLIQWKVSQAPAPISNQSFKPSLPADFMSPGSRVTSGKSRENPARKKRDCASCLLRVNHEIVVVHGYLVLVPWFAAISSYLGYLTPSVTKTFLIYASRVFQLTRSSGCKKENIKYYTLGFLRISDRF